MGAGDWAGGGGGGVGFNGIDEERISLPYRCGKKLLYVHDDTGGAYISPSFLITLFLPYSPNFPLGRTGEESDRLPLQS